MSADAWRICPKCNQEAVKTRGESIARAQSQYGKIAEPAYRKLIARAESPIELDQMYREDFQIRMNEDGTFEVSYSGHCRECGFEHSFKHEEKVLK